VICFSFVGNGEVLGVWKWRARKLYIVFPDKGQVLAHY